MNEVHGDWKQWKWEEELTVLNLEHVGLGKFLDVTASLESRNEP